MNNLDFKTNVLYHENSKKDKIIFPFGPVIFQTLIDDYFLNDLLFEGNKIKNDESLKFSKSLAGNLLNGNSYQFGEDFKNKWQSYIFSKVEDFFNLYLDSNCGVNDIIEILQVYCLNKKEYINGKINLDKLWINFQKKNDFNPTHTHSGQLSFVIYCKVPEKIFEINSEGNYKKAGEIDFIYGQKISALDKSNYTIRPFEKLMLIFPSTLQHQVPPFWVDEERVSVSGNINIVSR